MSLTKHCCTFAWLVAAAAGSWAMMRYENAPGSAGNPPQTWPSDSKIVRAVDQPTLIMLAHPRCPCTRASIGELAKLLAQCQGKARVYVLFTKPSGTSDGWEKSDLWQSAAAIPGVSVISDADGLEAKRFGVSTSGEALLFDAAGNLRFAGGITLSRGHSGDNPGRDALTAFLSTGESSLTSTAVFGCALCKSAECPPGAVEEIPR
ncbi:MAG TPA: hypothetical protein VFV83_01125 [Chthoniobacteraceae bacterium]|nr:hypothetical protein [Chthoniobacteraceae bacterium]